MLWLPAYSLNLSVWCGGDKLWWALDNAQKRYKPRLIKPW